MRDTVQLHAGNVTLTDDNSNVDYETDQNVSTHAASSSVGPTETNFGSYLFIGRPTLVERVKCVTIV